MISWSRVLVGSGLACLLVQAAMAQDPIADFYRGKQVKIIVGFTAGGSSSLYAQALARHMGKYIQGNPTLIVQHMPGGGGLVAANYIYNNAARDGSEFATTSRTAALEPLLGNQNASLRRTQVQLGRQRQ